METLYDAVAKVAAAAISAEVLCMLLPSGNMKKYVVVAVNLLIIMLLIEPILRIPLETYFK